MTKKEMAEEILHSSSAMGVSKTRFYKNVNKQSKEWIERLYYYVMNSKTVEEKKLNADFAMQWLKQEQTVKRYRVILEVVYPTTVEADSEEEAMELAMDECPYDNADEVEPIVEEIEDDK